MRIDVKIDELVIKGKRSCYGTYTSKLWDSIDYPRVGMPLLTPEQAHKAYIGCTLSDTLLEMTPTFFHFYLLFFLFLLPENNVFEI